VLIDSSKLSGNDDRIVNKIINMNIVYVNVNVCKMGIGIMDSRTFTAAFCRGCGVCMPVIQKLEVLYI